MRTIDSTVRTNYLSGDVTPRMTGTIRRLRLDFGGAPLVYNGTVSATTVSDDYYGKFVWGDAAITETTGYYIRLINKCAWGGTADYYASKTDDGSDAADWAYSDITNSSTTPASYCRVGIYPKVMSDSLYVWYMDASYNLYREELDPSTWAWSSRSSACSLASIAPDSIAIHPVTEQTAFVVGYKEPYLFTKCITYSGFWNAGDTHIISVIRGLEYTDALFSDAERLTDSGSVWVITANLQTHGAAYSILYDSNRYTYSQPFLICGGDADWTGYRVKPTGLSRINSRLWLVCQRELEGSDEIPMASHTSILSTSNGKSWREEDFVGIHQARGKLLYRGGEDYCFVAGNAAVYKASATNKLGNDAASLKQDLDEATLWEINCQGAGATHDLTIGVVNEDSAWSGSALLEADNEIVCRISTSGESESTLMTGYLVEDARERAFGRDRFQLKARGPISKMTGDMAWRPPAGKLYQGPEAFYSNFNLTLGNQSTARFTVGQVTGTWGTDWDLATNQHVLTGEAGLSLIPRLISAQYLTYMTHLKMKVSVEGALLVFYYENEDTYWRAGILRQETAGAPVPSTTTKLVIQRVESGTATTKASTTITPSLDTLYTLYAVLSPVAIAIYLSTGDDLSSATNINYAMAGETNGLPQSYHLGLESVNWIGYGGGYKDGWLTVVDNVAPVISLNIYDGGAGMDSGDVGNFCRIGTEFKRIIGVPAAGTMYLESAWGATPAVHDAYALYTDSSENGYPYTEFHDVAFCSGYLPWTIDDIANDVLETVGVGRTDVVAVNVPGLGDLSPYFRDVDVRWTSANPTFIFGATRYDASYTGYRVVVGDTHTELRHVSLENGDVLLYKWPNVQELPYLEQTEVRLLFDQDTHSTYVYAGDTLACAFWGLYMSGGYCAVGTGIGTGIGTGTSTEYRDIRDSFIWDVEEDANTALANLLRDRRAKLVERADGTVSLSAFETHDELGTWSTPLIELQNRRGGSPTLIELEGADVRAYYLNPDQARYRLRFRRASNEAITGEVETIREARRLMDLAEEAATHATPTLYAPDPAVEIEDEVTVDGIEYIVTQYGLALGHRQQAITCQMQAQMRAKKAAASTALWGTGAWGTMKWG